MRETSECVCVCVWVVVCVCVVCVCGVGMFMWFMRTQICIMNTGYNIGIQGEGDL